MRQDTDLLKRFRRGERDALERVYRTYVDQIEHIARYGFRILHKNAAIKGVSLDEIADLVQETFSRAFTERARLAYDGVHDYGPFLRTIARNLLADRARREGREIPLDDNFEEQAAAAGGDEEPWADEATMRVVREYLAAQPAELRALHEQRFVRGVSQEEAGRALNLSRQNVRTLEKRLRDGLAAALERVGIGVE